MATLVVGFTTLNYHFIFIATSHKHCVCTIIYVRFGNLSLFAIYVCAICIWIHLSFSFEYENYENCSLNNLKPKIEIYLLQCLESALGNIATQDVYVDKVA